MKNTMKIAKYIDCAAYQLAKLVHVVHFTIGTIATFPAIIDILKKMKSKETRKKSFTILQSLQTAHGHLNRLKYLLIDLLEK